MLWPIIHLIINYYITHSFQNCGIDIRAIFSIIRLWSRVFPPTHTHPKTLIIWNHMENCFWRSCDSDLVARGRGLNASIAFKILRCFEWRQAEERTVETEPEWCRFKWEGKPPNPHFFPSSQTPDPVMTVPIETCCGPGAGCASSCTLWMSHQPCKEHPRLPQEDVSHSCRWTFRAHPTHNLLPVTTSCEEQKRLFLVQDTYW